MSKYIRLDDATTEVYLHGEDYIASRLKRLTVINIIRCCECKHYGSLRGVPSYAPCNYWNIEKVIWNGYCYRAEPKEVGGKTIESAS